MKDRKNELNFKLETCPLIFSTRCYLPTFAYLVALLGSSYSYAQPLYFFWISNFNSIHSLLPFIEAFYYITSAWMGLNNF